MTAEMKEWGERQHESLERLYREGSLIALMEALYISSKCQIPWPAWATKGMVTILDELVNNNIKSRLGRHAKRIKQYHQDMIDWERYDTIQKLIENDVKWKDVYKSASQLLAETEAYGSANTMKKAYQRFKRRERETPWRYHVFSIYKPPSIGGRPANMTRLKLIEDVLRFDSKKS